MRARGNRAHHPAMALDKRLLEILRCPKCKGELETQLGEDGKTESGFVCWACGLRFPVNDGIPNFLVGDAEPVTR